MCDPGGTERIEAAYEGYVSALRELNSLRCVKPACGDDPNYVAQLRDARRRVKEAFAEWAMLFQHETGRKLALAC